MELPVWELTLTLPRSFQEAKSYFSASELSHEGPGGKGPGQGQDSEPSLPLGSPWRMLTTAGRGTGWQGRGLLAGPSGSRRHAVTW